LTPATSARWTVGAAQAAFPTQANGSLVVRDGKAIGSTLIGQSFVRSIHDGRAYHPWEQYRGDPRVMRLVTALESNLFCPHEPGLHAWVKAALFDEHDDYMHLADFFDYLGAHERADAAYTAPETWTRMAVLNVARIGRFSSDRTVREYARDVWGLAPA
jgi:starch phosphorylase